MFPGIVERTEKELENITKQNSISNLKVIGSQSKYSSWIGGSIFSSLSTFNKFVITKDQYDEHGPTLSHQKFN